MTAIDNTAIAVTLQEIGDLLEIKGANPFKIRAYRNAAEILETSAERLADLSPEQLLEIPGIGKDLAARIREIADTGSCAYHRELLAEFPASLLELGQLQGLGPKTVARLYRELGIDTIDALEAAAQGGQLRGLKGLGAKKEQLILRAIGERKRRVGRFLVADALEVATALVDHLQATVQDGVFVPVGSLRRGAETCGDVDILAIGVDPSVSDQFVSFPGVQRILGQGDTKSSVLLRNGIQVDLRIVPEESAGAALQYFTGSKPHNIALRDRALQRGLKLNEYGVFRLDDDTRVAGRTEEDIYAALDLPLIPPELRENRGEIAAADDADLPRLVDPPDLRGDLHSHTDATDGRADLETMAQAARSAGLEYLAVTDHSQALAMANGLDEHRTLAHAKKIRQLSERLEGITLLAGIECDILADGQLDLSADCLAQLDLVVASVHSAFGQEESQMTDRILQAMECPFVDIIGHPTGRLLLRREPYRVNVERLVDGAATHGVALEVNCQVDRLDLSDVNARLARDRGVKLVVSSDAHAPESFQLLRWGVLVARRAWASPEDILNTLPLADLKTALRRHASRRDAQ